ncbi:MAG: hypothetical protein M1812_007585 [Candelaria pacifica]|nr:MAG: hypothetical protein M1812_007585 [Candelaria pacifica]
METAIKLFFTSPQFAVIGASQDATKYGYKVFAWYHLHSLPVTPINPRTSSITLSPNNNPTSYPTIPSLSNLPSPSETSISIITPPAVTIGVLKEAKERGVRGVWLQPGSFDKEGLEFLKREFEGGVGGEGLCVLVDGEEGLRVAGREWERGKL